MDLKKFFENFRNYPTKKFVLNRWLVDRKDYIIDIILKNSLTSIFTLADIAKIPSKI
jgi:hypothetical protein